MALTRKNGEKPAFPPDSRIAAVLVDMQEKFVSRLSPEKREVIVLAQQKFLSICAEKDIPLVVLEYKGYGRTIIALEKLIRDVPLVIRLEKTCNNGFYKTMLEDILHDLRKDHLVFMGMNASACVLATATAAVHRGLGILTANDLIVDAPFPNGQKYNSRPWYRRNGMLVQKGETLLNCRP